jgi:hypothetical protein
MARPRAAAISFSLKIDNTSATLELSRVQGEPIRIKTSFSYKALTEQRIALREDLDSIKKSVGSEVRVTDLEEISSAMRKLHKRGRILAFQLFGTKLHEVVKMFQLACPKWQEETTLQPLVEVIVAIDDIVPVEFLPIFDTKEPKPLSDFANLVQVAHSFIGFSAIVKRVDQRAKLVSNLVLQNEQKLPVKLFHNAELEGAREEVDFFKTLAKADLVDLDGPWPDQRFDDRDQFANKVADHLWQCRLGFNGDIRFDGDGRPMLDQIHHFCCHCDTRADLSENYELVLATEEESYRVNVGQMQARFASLAVSHPQPTKEVLPLVFFNACGSSSIDPGSVVSFPKLFLELLGNRGFIGTETAIPDKVAAKFSKLFYLNLLQGDSLGEAIHAAKHFLLKRYNNPLGILYTMYANPDIRVRKPVTGEVIFDLSKLFRRETKGVERDD